jgi:hypothetical protein
VEGLQVAHYLHFLALHFTCQPALIEVSRCAASEPAHEAPACRARCAAVTRFCMLSAYRFSLAQAFMKALRSTPGLVASIVAATAGVTGSKPETPLATQKTSNQCAPQF